MTISGINFGRAATDYGILRAGFPSSLFKRLATFDVGLPGPVVIDLCTGAGSLARGFDANHATLLATRFPSAVLGVPCRLFPIVGQTAN